MHTSADIGCTLEDLPRATNEANGSLKREREREGERKKEKKKKTDRKRGINLGISVLSVRLDDNDCN